MFKYIYQHDNWPEFTWDNHEIQVALGKVRRLQGMVFARMEFHGMTLKEEAMLSTLTSDVLKSSEIEGENLSDAQVRSSIARNLGIEYAGMVPSNRNVDGVVEMMLDATQKYDAPLDEKRLFAWHTALFPNGSNSNMDVGCYRSAEMRVVSGAMGKEKVHFEAVPYNEVQQNMDVFLKWYNTESKLDKVLKAGIAHFWFIIIHPFDDGNGRIARALSDALLAQSDESAERYYSMSSQIMLERKYYYDILKKVQHSKGDITEWLDWYLYCIYRALLATEETMKRVLDKANFWDKHQQTEINSRQRLMLNKLLDGFEGKLKTSKWAKIAKCSADTALRDITDLMDKMILQKEEAGGRSTNYELVRDCL